MLDHIPDAQLFLQPQPIHHREQQSAPNVTKPTTSSIGEIILTGKKNKELRGKKLS
jgi:hypothetical protein